MIRGRERKASPARVHGKAGVHGCREHARGGFAET